MSSNTIDINYDLIAIQKRRISTALNSVLLEFILYGVYILLYFFTMFLYQRQRKARQQRPIIVIISLLFFLEMSQLGIQWYYLNWTFVISGDTRESIADASISYPSTVVHLLQNISYFGPFILADWLMTWRCYHVWGKSWKITTLPAFLLFSEIVIYFSLIILISVNIHSVTPAKARIFNSMHTALYIIPVIISIITTYLISHRIYINTRHSDAQGVQISKLIRVMEIVIQSSAMYTVLLLITACVSTSVPIAQRPEILNSVYNYAAAILVPMTGLVPTAMVARVTQLSSSSNLNTRSTCQLSNMQFRGQSSSANMDCEETPLSPNQ